MALSFVLLGLMLGVLCEASVTRALFRKRCHPEGSVTT